MKLGFKSPRKIFHFVVIALSNFTMPGHWRWHILKFGGINFTNETNEKEFRYIGKNVVWDTAYPEEIEIGNNVHITTGCVLLTHYLTLNDNLFIKWKKGHIKIEDNVFIGAKSIITKPVTIGRNSIVAAGSVVTKDIPPYEVWGGVPAKFIKKLAVHEKG